MHDAGTRGNHLLSVKVKWVILIDMNLRQCAYCSSGSGSGWSVPGLSGLTHAIKDFLIFFFFFWFQPKIRVLGAGWRMIFHKWKFLSYIGRSNEALAAKHKSPPPHKKKIDEVTYFLPKRKPQKPVFRL